MTTFTKDQLSELLRSGECVVEFTKINGEIRTMPCTLSESLIPPAPIHTTNTNSPVDFPRPKKEKKENPSVMSVWCLDKKEWRSFRVANVISAKALE